MEIQSQATWTREAIERQLHNLYYAAGDSGSYGGVERLYQRARELRIPVSRPVIRSYLSKQLAYSLHKPVRHKFERNKTYAAHIDQQWQADLADMQTLASENDGYRYILTCIDIISRYAWAVPVRSKLKKDMLTALKRLVRIANPRLPQRLQTDKGKEFFNAELSNFLRAKGIHHFASNSDQKAAVVERFNRTLKNRIWTYFTANNTKRYVDVLGDITHSYNNTVHRSIGMRPADVDGEEAARKAWTRLFYRDSCKIATTHNAQAINTGQRARITRWKGNFEKGYLPNWSREHFIVQQRAAHPRAVYKITDSSGEPIEGAFYGAELQAIDRNTLEVERVIRVRNRGARKEVFVKWCGWPEKFNRWILHSDLASYTATPRDSSNDG
jgi:hypothetical protein